MTGTHTVTVANLNPGDIITQSGHAFEGAVVAETAREAWDGFSAWVQVPLTNGEVMDLDGWDVQITVRR